MVSPACLPCKCVATTGQWPAPRTSLCLVTHPQLLQVEARGYRAGQLSLVYSTCHAGLRVWICHPGCSNNIQSKATMQGALRKLCESANNQACPRDAAASCTLLLLYECHPAGTKLLRGRLWQLLQTSSQVPPKCMSSRRAAATHLGQSSSIWTEPLAWGSCQRGVSRFKQRLIRRLQASVELCARRNLRAGSLTAFAAGSNRPPQGFWTSACLPLLASRC